MTSFVDDSKASKVILRIITWDLAQRPRPRSSYRAGPMLAQRQSCREVGGLASTA